MKKVLFISLAKHNTLGGTQNYNVKLIKLFTKLGWDITEYNCNLGIDKEIAKPFANVRLINNSSVMCPTKFQLLEGWRFMHQVKVSNTEVVKLVNQNHYDLIIDARQHPYKWFKRWGTDFSKSSSTIWVQHFCLGIYDGKYLSKSKFASLVMYFYINKLTKHISNVLYAHRNIVLFDQYNAAKLDLKRLNPDTAIEKILLTEYDRDYILRQKSIKFQTRDIDFLYVGRINQVQKNINFTNKVFRDDLKIVVVGDGDKHAKEMILKNPNIDYKGFISQDKVHEYFKRAKYLFLPSNYEGFPYSVVQALSHGCIPIMLDTFESASFFKLIGHVYDKTITVSKMQSELRKLKSADDHSTQAVEFAAEHLSNESFNAKWSAIIKKHDK